MKTFLVSWRQISSVCKHTFWNKCLFVSIYRA